MRLINKIKLKWEVFGLVFLLSMLIVCVFCLFQIFMLDGFYKNNKIKSIDFFLEEVENSLTIDNLNDDATWKTLQNIASENEVAVYLFDLKGNEINSVNQGMYYKDMTNDDNFNDVINKAQAAGLDTFFITFEHYIPSPNKTFYPAITKDFISSADTAIIRAKFLAFGTITYLLVLDARLAPVQPAVETMQQQLLYITLIVIVLSFIISIFISNIISRPINKMNSSAKLLALGKRDITFVGRGYKEITELNETLNYAVEELNKTEVLQKELLANISHDLKTPLTLISGYAEMMKDLPSEVTEENLNVIVEETKRLNLLVNDLLNLSKLQAKTEIFNDTKYNLTSSILGIVDRQNKFFAQKGFNINFKYEKEVEIFADESKISQVLYNFINNGVNYSKDILQIDVIQEVNDQFVKIKVVDYGVGIKEDELDVIWDRYYRVDKALKRSVQGSGLGLSIVKEILNHYGYQYGVESKFGEGSTFYFIIPINN